MLVYALFVARGCLTRVFVEFGVRLAEAAGTAGPFRPLNTTAASSGRLESLSAVEWTLAYGIFVLGRPRPLLSRSLNISQALTAMTSATIKLFLPAETRRV